MGGKYHYFGYFYCPKLYVVKKIYKYPIYLMNLIQIMKRSE